ncbi:hypothetical protein EMCRGX_G019615 [Ephydatia muelleri]
MGSSQPAMLHNLQSSTQYSFVEAACTTAGCQTGGVANVTTLDSVPVGQAPPSSSIPLPLSCPSNGMLPSNPTMSSLPTPCTIESPALSPSQRCGHLLRRPQSSSIPTTPAAFSSTRSTGYVVLFKLASNTFYITMDTVHAAAITATIVPLLTMKHVSYPLLNAPDGFDAVWVQNVGSTYMIVSWDLPTDSNGILINFSLYCNGALAGVLPLTVIPLASSPSLCTCTCPPVTPAGTALQLEWASSVLQPACPDPMEELTATPPYPSWSRTTLSGGSMPNSSRELTLNHQHGSSITESCRLAHLSVKVEAGNNLTPDHSHTRPADVLVQNWSRGRPAAFDICVTSPLNTLTLSEAGVCAGAAAQAGEVRKHSANDDKCGDLGWFCVPLVTETYGAWGAEAKACFSQLASRLSIRLQKPKSVILYELYGRLNTCLVRCVATAILSRIQSS